MELMRIEIVDSPEGPARIRLMGEVKYEGSGATEQIWFDYPRQYANELSVTGNPWLSALIPLAVTLNEPLRLRSPVDAKLLKGVREVNRIWRSWYPHLPIVPIEADATAPAPTPPPSRCAAFFSGGLDSFFTLLRSRAEEEPANDLAIDDLITLWGFDLPLERREAGQQLFERHQRIADLLGKEFVGIATNLRVTRWREADWQFVSHGPALAAAGLTLEKRYHTVLIAATGGYRDLHSCGSHPLTDPLFSTTATTLRQDGLEATRVEKTRLLATSELGLKFLHVCWISESADNCANCNKCYRTMLILELLGALQRCPAFGCMPIDLRKAARIYCAHSWHYRELRDIEQLALTTGRQDVARAARKAMQRSERLSRRLERLRFFRRFGRTWRWSKRAERYLLRNWLR